MNRMRVGLVLLGVGLGLAGCDGSVSDGPGDGGPRDDAMQVADGNVTVDGALPGDDGATLPDGPNVDRTNPDLHEWELDPAVLDSMIADSTGIEYAALDTRVAPIGKLVIFLPGANNLAVWWADHGEILASFGFHVVIPHYNNRWSSNGTCDGQGSDCSINTRWEALVGEDLSSAIAIARRDSAEGRVVRMLQHLRDTDPGGDWGYYLNGDALRYDRMIIAGISHGGASAALYGERRAFTRVVIHASSPAGTKSAPKSTPLSEWYGFVHVEDGAYGAITGAWANYGLSGSLTSVDNAEPPYGNSHQLTSAVPIGDPDDAHISVCVSGPSPKEGDDYVYEPAWRYLYGVAQP